MARPAESPVHADRYEIAGSARHGILTFRSNTENVLATKVSDKFFTLRESHFENALEYRADSSLRFTFWQIKCGCWSIFFSIVGRLVIFVGESKSRTQMLRKSFLLVAACACAFTEVVSAQDLKSLLSGVAKTVVGDQATTAASVVGTWTFSGDRKSTRLNSSHSRKSRMPSSA